MDRASWCQEAANFNRSQHGHTGNTLQANALARAVCHSNCTVPRACTLQVMPRLLPTLPQPSVDSVKKDQSSVGIRVAACRRSLPEYTPLGSECCRKLDLVDRRSRRSAPGTYSWHRPRNRMPRPGNLTSTPPPRSPGCSQRYGSLGTM